MNQNDVRDFGATGDGLGDDTQAIQDALDAGGTTLFPAGIYTVRRLTVPSGAILRGIGGGSFDMPELPASQFSVLKLLDGAEDHLLYGPPESQRVIIEDLQLDGNRYNQTATSCGIYLEAGAAPPPPPYTQEAQWVLRRVYIHDCRTDGLYIGANRRNNLVDACTFAHNRQHGINIWGTDCTFRASNGVANGAYGINVGAALTRILGGNLCWNLIGVNVISQTFGMVLTGAGIDRNYRQGVRLEPGAVEGVVSSNVFGSNSQEADGVYAHVLVGEGCRAVVCGNAFVALAAGLPYKPSYAVELEAGAWATGIEHSALSPNSTSQGLSNARALDGWWG